MTTKRQPREKAGATPSKPNLWKGFANIELPQSCKEEILNESQVEGALESALDNLIAAGFKVTFSYDARSGCIQATAVGTENSGSSAGYATSARSESITRGVLALAVKVFEVADGDLSQFVTEKVNRSEI